MVDLMTYKASKEGEALDHPPQQGCESQREALGCSCPNSAPNIEHLPEEGGFREPHLHAYHQ